MTEKQKDQFLCDYLIEGSTTSVDSRWLQTQLQELKQLRRIVKQPNQQELSMLRSHNRQLIEEVFALENQNKWLQSRLPAYHLNTQG